MIRRPEHIPSWYWKSMQVDSRRELIAQIVADGYEPLPSGSRWICPAYCSTQSDWDWYLQADAEYVKKLEDRGFGRRRLDAHPQSFPQMRTDGACLYQQDVNLVVIYPAHIGHYDSFKRATDFCKLVGGPQWRDGRVEVFETFKKTASTEEAIAQLADAHYNDCRNILHDGVGSDHPEFMQTLVDDPLIVADYLEELCDARCELLRQMADKRPDVTAQAHDPFAEVAF